SDEDCCNSCEEVREAYRKKGWGLSDPEIIDQVVPTVYTDIRDHTIQSNQVILVPAKVVFGVFTVSGILDSFIYHGQRAIKKKIEIGKFS
ncbi:hypothetical protein B296_00011743, partial [Ensete ventricosum]